MKTPKYWLKLSNEPISSFSKNAVKYIRYHNPSNYNLAVINFANQCPSDYGTNTDADAAKKCALRDLEIQATKHFTLLDSFKN